MRPRGLRRRQADGPLACAAAADDAWLLGAVGGAVTGMAEVVESHDRRRHVGQTSWAAAGRSIGERDAPGTEPVVGKTQYGG